MHWARMMEILYYPDPRLTLKSEGLGSLSQEGLGRVDEMRRLLEDVGGAGLAAPQVGWNVRLFILRMAGDEGDATERVIYDPQIALLGDRVRMPEGCLSFPGMSASIERNDRIRLVGKTPDGPIDQLLIGFEAQAVQHEMDHLDGILYIERMTPADLKRNALVLRGLEERWKRRKA